MRAIRPFVSFDYDLRKPLDKIKKQKIKRYYDEISALTNRPYQIVRPRRKDHLRAAQEFAQHEKKLPELKVAFVPTDGIHKVKLDFTRKGVIARGNFVTSVQVRLSKKGLLMNPLEHVKTRIKNVKADSFHIQAGKYEIRHTYSKSRVAQAVARLVGIYSNQEKNNYFGNWLHGLTAYTFKNQASEEDYRRAKTANIKAGKRKRRAAARKKARTRNMGR